MGFLAKGKLKLKREEGRPLMPPQNTPELLGSAQEGGLCSRQRSQAQGLIQLCVKERCESVHSDSPN